MTIYRPRLATAGNGVQSRRVRTFTGTMNYFKLDDSGLPTQLLLHFPVSGTYSNTASGVTFDGQFTANDSVVTFSTIGCRAN